jgi:uncharacterized protein with beta-barrel porin domain
VSSEAVGRPFRLGSADYETEVRGEAGARPLASTALAGLVAAVMPTALRAVMPAISLLALGNPAHATCDANGIITGANGAIALNMAGCATAPGVMSATVVSGGTVTAATGDGVTSVASPGWAVTNQGTITATGNAVTGDVSFTLTNSGAMTAGSSGALIGGGSTVVNLAGGTITGDFTGLSISANGGSTSGGPSTVDNAGTITSATGFNDAILLGLGGTVTNRSTGTIRANGVGVAGATNPTTVNNFGQILDASTGIGLSAGGTVTNGLGAVISSGSRGVDIAGGVGTVVNSGSILASVGRAVVLQAGGSVTNTSAGTITSGGTRVILVSGGPSTIVNAGSIDGGTVAAIEVESTQSSITNSGTIHTASGAGIQLDATGASNTLTTIVNNAGGTIQGAVNALVANGNASVDFTNKGTVVGDLVFGAGNVALHFYTGSSLTGNLTAGTGTNTISFNGSGNGTFSSPIANFQAITKQDDGTWTLSGVVSGATALNVTQGTLILSAANTYTGATTINSGVLIVDGSIGNSATTVNNGGTLAGTGVVGNVTVANGGTFAPGPVDMPGAIAVNGNLAFQPGAFYLVQVNPSTASVANVSGTATLTGGTVDVLFAPGSYIAKQYTILHSGGLGGTTFSGLSGNVPPNFTERLSYTATDVLLDLTATLGAGVGLNQNQRNVASAINGFFNAGGTLPPAFGNLFGLTGGNLANALTLLSGEAATGAQQSAFQLMTEFIGIMLDPFVDGRRGIVGGPALGFASEPEVLPDDAALADARVTKAPAYKGPPPFVPYWLAWGGAYGGYNRTDGDPAGIGSHDLATRTGGLTAGLDYHVAPYTVVGFALAGGGTSWGLAQGLGGGKSDAFQAGAYGATQWGPAYVAAALAFTNHWMSTDRFAAFADHLTASFDAQSFGGRAETGYRFPTPIGGMTPYAAVQAQGFHTPAYAETDASRGGFALNFNARTATDTRSELGGRFDYVAAVGPSAILTLRGRLG